MTVGALVGRSVTLLLSAVALCALGCSAKIEGTIPQPQPNPGSGEFRAGAGTADLTPIPGIPMAGYSMGGKIARGSWGRLLARALYIEAENGVAIALVACDIDQIPNGLSDRVAHLLRTETTIDHLGRQQIILGASHTHHGPGTFFTSRMYNSFTGARSGFDEELFDFLARRIVDAIELAYNSRDDAVLRIAPAGADDRLSCVFRNRSRLAFEHNPENEVSLLRGKNQLPSPCPARCPDEDACESVHTRIDYFVVTRKPPSSDVIGVAVFLAAHATVLTTENELYSPDFFGVTSHLVSSLCPSVSSDTVVAIFNGAEGDVSPAWEPGRRDRKDVLGISTDIASEICSIIPSADPVSVPEITFRWEEVYPLTDRTVDDPFDLRDSYDQQTARKALVGAPAIGGAEDGRTVLHEMGFVEGMRGPVRNDQGIKQPYEVTMVGVRTTVAGLINDTPPQQAPIGVYKVGDVVLVTLPGEFTTMLGEQIREHVAKSLPVSLATSADRVFLVGLAGGHVSYVTTPEEYEAQHYEGASNIYGAATGPLITDRLGVLAQSGLGGPVPKPRPYSYEPGKKVRWRPRDSAGPPYEVHEGLADIVQDPVTHKPKSDYPTYCFRDAVPRLAEIAPGGTCQRAMPEVWIQDATTLAEITGPREFDMVTVLTGVGKDAATNKDATEWCGIWMVPPGTTGDYRFRIEPIVGAPRLSPPFTIPSSPPFLAFESPAWIPLVPDRAEGIWCSFLSFLGLCPEPLTCQAP